MANKKGDNLGANLITGVYFRVEGTAGQDNALPWNILKKMGDHLQELIKNIAKFDLTNVNSPESFEIELYDFRPGSAVPAFRFRNNPQEVIATTAQSQSLSVAKQFDDIMKIAEGGNYLKLNERYASQEVRNEIAKDLYEFVNAPGNSPLSIVKPSGRRFRKIYKVSRFSHKAFSNIYSRVSPKDVKKKEEERIIAYGRVSLPVEKRKGSRGKIIELYKSDGTTMSFAPHHIVLEDKVYNLHNPLMCLFHKEDGYYVIENPLMDLYATGETEEEAELSFYQEFDHAFTRFNELSDDQLSDRLLRAKQAINLIVKDITKD